MGEFLHCLNWGCWHSHAVIALRSSGPGKAVEALAAAAPYELGGTNDATAALHVLQRRLRRGQYAAGQTTTRPYKSFVLK
jgi:hypothetical protein